MTDPEEELQRIAGIGRATARRLIAAGYTTIEAIARASPEELEGMFGGRAAEFIVAAKETSERAEAVGEAEMVAVGEKVPSLEEAVEIEKIPEEVKVMAEVDK